MNDVERKLLRQVSLANVFSLIELRMQKCILLFFVPYLYIALFAFFLVGESLSKLMASLILLAPLLLAYVFRNKKLAANFALFLAILFLICGAFIEVSGYFKDIFYDSRSYHFNAVKLISDGWNPIYNWSATCPDNFCSASVYALHYPKSFWMVQALFYVLFEKIAVLPFVAFITFLAAIFVVYDVLSVWIKDRLLSLGFTVVLALNPTFVWQLFSGYADGFMSHVLLIVLFAVVGYLFLGKNKYRWILLVYIPLLVNIKFTGLVYSAVIILLFLIVGLFLKLDASRLRVVFIFSVLGGLGGLITGFNPYVTNSISKGNPFYPAYSPDQKKNIISGQADALFIEKGRLEKLFISIFSTGSKNNPYKPELELPFSRMDYFPKSSTRFSGNGPWFSGLLLLSLVYLIKASKIQVAILIAIFGSLLITDAAWYARLAPQLWWVPIVLIAFSRPFRLKKKFDYVLLAIAGFNILIIAFNLHTHQFKLTLKSKNIVETSDFYVYKGRKFKEYSESLLREEYDIAREVLSDTKGFDCRVATAYRGLLFCRNGL